MEAIDAVIRDLPPFVTRPEVADLLRCRREFISDLIRQGELTAIQRRARQGSRVLIPKESLRAYLERSRR